MTEPAGEEIIDRVQKMVNEVTQSVERLIDRVGGLDKHVKISEAASREIRVLVGRANANAAAARSARKWALTVALFALIISGAGFGYALRTNNAINHNARVACENANESRSANLQLWKFVISASSANTQTPRQKQLSRALDSWIEELYQTHDCSDLGRQYQVPDPPQLPKLEE